jgi:hypothetical protein
MFQWGRRGLVSKYVTNGEIFEVFRAVKIKVEVFWFLTTRKDVLGYHRFGEPCCIHLQGEEVNVV